MGRFSFNGMVAMRSTRKGRPIKIEMHLLPTLHRQLRLKGKRFKQ
jgi:hypothetical protein